MSKRNTEEIDAFVTDERTKRMAKKSAKMKHEAMEGEHYACVGGNPKMRREMKRKRDLAEKRGKKNGKY